MADSVDLSNPQGFNAWFEGIADAFRSVAIDDELDGGNLDPVNAHIVGPTTESTLASQYAFPVVWSVFEGHVPDYATTASDQGQVRARVVTMAADSDPKRALDDARTLAGRIVNNVEANRSLVVDGTAHAEGAFLTDISLDFRITSGEDRAQVKYAQLLFDIDVKRRY